MVALQSPLDIADAYTEIPGTILDCTYVGKCECGDSRNFGYMGITADRWAEIHRSIGPAHNVTIEVTDAPPMTRAIMRHKIKLRHSWKYDTVKTSDSL